MTRLCQCSLAGLSLILCVGGLPARAGIVSSEDAASRIEKYLTRWHESGHFHGAALVARGGEVILKRGFGFADRENAIENSADTKFHIGSISKQFTTVLVLKLAAEGRLKLDDRLSDHLPEYRRDIGERVTIDHLLRHTSGMRCYVRDSRPGTDGTGAFTFGGRYSRRELISRFMSEDLLFEPGADYHYSSTGFYLLALVVEKLTGQPHHENVRKLVASLGLNNTGVIMPGHAPANSARGYVRVPRGFAPAPDYHAPNTLGAGGMYSTVEELFAWNRALHSDKLLPRKWRKRMFEVYHRGVDEGHAYSVNHYSIRDPGGGTIHYTGFSGGLPGFQSDAFHFPDEDLTVVLLDNSSQYEHWRMAPAIRATVTGARPELPPLSPAPMLAREAVEDKVAAAVKTLHRLKATQATAYEFLGLESELNAIGYNALGADLLGDALAVFELNVELHPDSWNVYDSLGEALREAGNLERSKEMYARSREIKGRENRLLKLIGTGEYDEVRRQLEKTRAESPGAQVFTPSRIGPMFGQAFQAGDNERAIAIAEAWALGNPRAAGPYFSLARVYERTSQREKQAACYRRILEISPDGPHVDRVRGQLEKLGGDS